MIYDLSQFEPFELGLPADKFPMFRPKQTEAIEAICNTPKYAFLGCMPLGFGKSAVAVAAAKALGLRAKIVTATKALMEQYLGDFKGVGMTEIRGKANYPCAANPGLNCKQGASRGCPHTRGAGCTYESHRDTANASDLHVTNYAYHIHTSMMPNGPTPCDLVIYDEGHRAEMELSKCLQTTLRESWLRDARLDNRDNYPHEDDIAGWVEWSETNLEYVKELTTAARVKYRKSRSLLDSNRLDQLEQLVETMEAMHTMNSQQWICELRKGTSHGRCWDFHPIWPAQFASRYLFGGVGKVVVLSATLRPMVAGLLGLLGDGYEFREWPRVFPPHLSPVYLYTKGRDLKLKYGATDFELQQWLEVIDEILDQRQDRKGLIHTVSYERQRYLLAHSRWRGRFIANTADPDSPSAYEVVKTFKASREPLVLVSPSVGTGWDFPGQDCEFQIIAKVPFPNVNDKLMKARTQKNKRYPLYLAMNDIMQMVGRPTRSPTDRSETFIVDGNFKWFFYSNRAMAPNGFEYREISSIPKSPERVTM